MSESIVLKGNLSFVSLADLFQILGGNNCTGVLHLKSRHVPTNAIVYFKKGSPINSTCGSLKGIKSIHSLFGWTEGEFEFREGDVQVAKRIKQSRMEIILDSLRLLDDGQIEMIGPPSFGYASSGKKPGAGEENDLSLIKGPLADFSHVVGEDSFSDGKIIVKEGGYGKWLSIVNEGTARVKRETPNGYMDIARLGAGSYIGSLRALLYGDLNRSATVHAEGNVHLLTLDSDFLHREYISLSPTFQKLLLSVDDRLIKITDRVIDLNQKKDSADGFAEDKKLIIGKGSDQKNLYYIRQGTAYIIGQTRKGVLQLLTLGKEDIFGYNPFFDYGHEPRMASVLASDDLEITKVDTSSLQKEFDGLSNTLQNMIYHVFNCITTTTRLVYRLHSQN